MKEISRKSSATLCSELTTGTIDNDLVINPGNGCLDVEPGTRSGRRLYWCRMICFPFIPILALFIQNTSIFLQQRATYDQAKYVNQQVIHYLNGYKGIGIIYV